MSDPDDLAFGFDLSELGVGDNNADIPLAENEFLRAPSDEASAIQFVDATMPFTVKKKSFAQEIYFSALGNASGLSSLSDSDHDATDEDDGYVQQTEIAFSLPDVHVFVLESTDNLERTRKMSAVHDINSFDPQRSETVYFSDSEIDEQMTDDEHFEQCRLGLEDRTLPYDFEKTLRWKPMYTVVPNVHVRRMHELIAKTMVPDTRRRKKRRKKRVSFREETKYEAFDSDSDDQHSSASDSDDSDADHLHQLGNTYSHNIDDGDMPHVMCDMYSGDMSDDDDESDDEGDGNCSASSNSDSDTPITMLPKMSVIHESMSYVDTKRDVVIEMFGVFQQPNQGDDSPPSPLAQIQPSKQLRICSTFRPNKYDIVLMESSPLALRHVHVEHLSKDALEYLHCASIDQDKLYEKIWTTLLRTSFQVRCGNLNGNLANVDALSRDGGSKIFQFVAHCCNPCELRSLPQMSDLQRQYHELTKHLTQPLHEDYVLMESVVVDSNTIDDSHHDMKEAPPPHIIHGEWVPYSRLRQHFTPQLHDVLIVMSPDHQRMVDIFITMGYANVIGIETLCQRLSNTAHWWAITDFLHHFYSALLNQESLLRAFRLAKYATKKMLHDEMSERGLNKLARQFQKLDAMQSLASLAPLKSVEPSQSVGVALRMSAEDDRMWQNDEEGKFILRRQRNDSMLSFIVFPELHRGEPQDMLGSMLSHTRHCKSNFNHAMLKPFIGRSTHVLQLYRALYEHQIVVVAGRENDGRKSLVKRLVGWLYEHNYFDDGLIVLDVKSELTQKRMGYQFKDILGAKLAEMGFPEIQSKRRSYNNVLSMPNTGHLLTPMISVMDAPPAASITFVKSTSTMNSVASTMFTMKDVLKTVEKLNICFVFFNVDCWDNDDIYHFMDEYATLNNNRFSPCICTVETASIESTLPSTTVHSSNRHHKNPSSSVSLSINLGASALPSALPTTPSAYHPAKSQLVNQQTDSPGSAKSSPTQTEVSVVDELLRGPEAYFHEKSISIAITRKRSAAPMAGPFGPSYYRQISHKSKISKSAFMLKYHVMKIEGLTRAGIADLFAQLCYGQFDKTEVANHAEIQKIFDGKPGNTKRVAAFFQFLSNQHYEVRPNLSLDVIAQRLTHEDRRWMADFHKRVFQLFKKASSRTIGSLRRIHQRIENLPQAQGIQVGVSRPQPQSALFQPQTSVFQPQTSVFQPQTSVFHARSTSNLDRDERKTVSFDVLPAAAATTAADTIEQIQNAQNMAELLPILQRMEFDKLKQLLIGNHQTLSPHAVPVHKPWAPVIIEHGHDDDTPPLMIAHDHHRDSSTSSRKVVVVNDEHNQVVRTSGGIKTVAFDLPSVGGKLQSKLSVELTIQESDTEESFVASAAILDDERFQDDTMNVVWQKIADAEDKRFARLYTLQSSLQDQFYSITKLRNIAFFAQSKKQLTSALVKKWYVYSTNCGDIDDQHSISTKHFEQFWKWFTAMAHIVYDIYGEQPRYAHEKYLDIFFDRKRISESLKDQSNGTFMLCLGKQRNELVILYVRNNKIKELSLLRTEGTNRCQYIISRSYRSQNAPHVQIVFEYINAHAVLGQILTTKRGLVDKRIAFPKRSL